MGRRRHKEADPAEVAVGIAGLLGLLVGLRHGVVAGVLCSIVLAFVAFAIIAALAGPKPASGKTSSRSPFIAPTAADSDRVWQARTPPVAEPAGPSTPTEWSLQLIRDLEWKRFEELCEGYWKAKGYRARSTGPGADGGVDVELFAMSAPEKLFGVVQCKSRISELIGVHMIRELFGVMHHFHAPLGVMMTSSDFTDDAIRFAEGKHLKLISGAKLLELISGLPDELSKSLLNHVTSGDYWTPSCPACELKMLPKGKAGASPSFWGCPNFRFGCRQKIQMDKSELSAHADASF